MKRLNAHKVERGQKAHKSGHLSEYIALVHLLLTGHRILGFRLKTPEGEIDILAQRGQRLAVIEVKQRRTVMEALTAVSPTQKYRLWQAGHQLQARRPQLAKLSLHVDLYVVTPRCVRYVRDAFADGI
ncbi:MAG: YraN family protein [Asticcacaulis sp.]|jgi:putative endonuclease|uniref:YraN family protein n=1 Tax=Asticcacaulis sp. TaxID=1872648 RepID=UPI0025BB89C2|nr:YraN family protein [Asticcacaulis sp.]MCA1934231.1 YraN family protein [Asticcacaulis sp.]